jgi:hypothetical protein
MIDRQRLSKEEIESEARAYLERSRSLHTPPTGHKHMVSGKEFEALVEKEVEQTIRQLRSVGKQVLD